jgi:hypothetical protein
MPSMLLSRTGSARASPRSISVRPSDSPELLSDLIVVCNRLDHDLRFCGKRRSDVSLSPNAVAQRYQFGQGEEVLDPLISGGRSRIPKRCFVQLTPACLTPASSVQRLRILSTTSCDAVLTLLCSTHSGEASNPTQFRPSNWASSAVVPLPTKGSNTVSPGPSPIMLSAARTNCGWNLPLYGYIQCVRYWLTERVRFFREM